MKQLKLLVLGLTVIGSSAFALSAPYGAIAYSASDGKYGIATKEVNQEAAEQRAMGNCAVLAGGRDCRNVLWFYNACAALSVASNGAWGVDYDVTTAGELMKGINGAYQKAKGYCRQFGGQDCRLEQAVCSFD